MSTAAGIVILIGRILLVIFPAYVSGYQGHFRSAEGYRAYARSVEFPVIGLVTWPAGLWLVAASLSIAVGIWPDLGSLMLAVFMIPTAYYFHAFWKAEDPQQKASLTQLFYRNVIMFGACLIMFGFFASVDHGLRFAITGSLFHL
jgi:putative oxidoreductase